MRFEEALSLLREGKRITHPSFDEDVYFIGCYLNIYDPFNHSSPDKERIIEEIKSLGMSITKMKGANLHPDMLPEKIKGTFPDPITLPEPCKHGYMPQLNLLLVMSDDWKIYKEKVNP